MSKYPPKITKLPFDQFSRQHRARQLIDALRKPQESFTILDVGGYKGATKLFHPEDNVTVLDVFPVKEKDYIQGDATEMSFEDGSYDFVVSFDVFEHIPRDKREAFAAECSRVAKRGVIIAAPVGTHENTYAEKAVNELYKSLHKKDHEWLIEHIEYKLPEPGLAQKLLDKNNLKTFSFSSNYTPLWVLMQSAIFGASKFDALGKKIDELYELYNTTLESDGVPETDQNYRAIILGVKTPEDKKTIESKIHRIFSDKKTYFSDLVSINLAIAELMIRGTDELFIKNTQNEKQIKELQQELKQAADDKVGLGQQRDIYKQLYEETVNSKAYRYARAASSALHKPKKILRRKK